MKKMRFALFLFVVTVVAAGCSQQAPTERSAQKAAAAPGSDEPAEELEPPVYESALPEDMRGNVDKVFTGDFEEMIKRRIVRVGVTFNRTFYFVDKGTQRGLAYEYVKVFEDDLNTRLKTGNLRIHVVLLPMPRDLLLSSLQAGKVDMVVAQLTVTPERQKLVDFTTPTRRNVDEVVVTGPGGPTFASVEDLSGKEVFVRKSSSYYESLVALNQRLTKQGKAPVSLEDTSESLEDDDLLEMVNAGLIPATVVDNYLANYWKQMFPDLNVHNSITLRTGGNLAVAIRKNSPQTAAELNRFIGKNGLDSTIGATLNKRYLESTTYARNAASAAERAKFIALVDLFKRYGDKYSFDYLLMAAQGYQESRLDQGAKSPVGAIGVMQLMPATGKEQNVGDVNQLEPNIHAGVKYMRFVRDQYFDKEPMDDLNKGLFTFASYNAGPGRIRQLRREAQKRGLDPNVWFGNVERIASERIGRETVTYVSNIYKYYVAYKLISTENARRKAAKEAIEKSSQ
jgi:membrane-bound lytic murein transglycosylase MltF